MNACPINCPAASASAAGPLQNRIVIGLRTRISAKQGRNGTGTRKIDCGGVVDCEPAFLTHFLLRRAISLCLLVALGHRVRRTVQARLRAELRAPRIRGLFTRLATKLCEKGGLAPGREAHATLVQA
jgi:hypothetical protein